MYIYRESRAKYRTDRQQGLEGVVTIYTVHVYIYIVELNIERTDNKDLKEWSRYIHYMYINYIYSRAKYRKNRQQGLEGVVTIYIYSRAKYRNATKNIGGWGHNMTAI